MSRGRPRSVVVDDALSAAVHRLLASRSYAALTIEEVARTAKVGKGTIYRRWASKAEMVFALVVHGETIEPPADQGSLPADMRVLAGRILARLSAPAAQHALPGVLADLRGDPRLTDRFQASFAGAQRRVVTTVLERAVARGELAASIDAPHVHAQLLGTAFAWLFLIADAPPPDLADRLTAEALAILRNGEPPCPPSSSRRCPTISSTSATAAGSPPSPTASGRC